MRVLIELSAVADPANRKWVKFDDWERSLRATETVASASPTGNRGTPRSRSHPHRAVPFRRSSGHRQDRLIDQVRLGLEGIGPEATKKDTGRGRSGRPRGFSVLAMTEDKDRAEHLTNPPDGYSMHSRRVRPGLYQAIESPESSPDGRPRRRARPVRAGRESSRTDSPGRFRRIRLPQEPPTFARPSDPSDLERRTAQRPTRYRDDDLPTIFEEVHQTPARDTSDDSRPRRHSARTTRRSSG